MTASDRYVATETFATELDGAPVVVHKGVTRVREGHALLRSNPGYFKPDTDVHYDVERTSAAPGEKRTGVKRQPKPAVDQD